MTFLSTDDAVDDSAWMDAALGLASRGLGRVWPNPAVACLIVQHGVLVGRGWTQPGGRPHAETEALRRAGPLARGATAFVTLEPCAHQGSTPPCADALIAAGVSRVVVAVEDPDPRVAGRGFQRLRDAGIALTIGVGERKARDVNRGFFLAVHERRPWVTLKLATSLDGRIATATGDSRWITGPTARAEGHRLRGCHDAVLTGIGTVLTDDPALTCRLPGMANRSPVRVIADTRLRTPREAAIARTARAVPTWLLTRPGSNPTARDSLRAQGVDFIDTAVDRDERLDPHGMLAALAARGITRLLIESGGALAGAFLAADRIDQIVWFRAPIVLGSDGLPAIALRGIERVVAAKKFCRTDIRRAAEDLVETFQRSY
jgi:diaminohydroxyphosphoribosylaminopyrimidine deaminase/5-amino-6-(5-phosphoribosylamino)uracil reductase